MTPLPPAVQTWFERHAQASTDTERQALVTALCAWQRAQDVKALEAFEKDVLVVGDAHLGLRVAIDHLRTLE